MPIGYSATFNATCPVTNLENFVWQARLFNIPAGLANGTF